MTFRIKNGMIITDWAFILWLAWGPRELSSSARAAGVKAYGGMTTAHWRMWLAWIMDRPRRMRRGPAIVVLFDREGHGARYAKELDAREEEARKAHEKAEMLARLDDLQRLRAEARARRDFVTADRLRAEIEAAGIQVNDQALMDVEPNSAKEAGLLARAN